MRGTAWEHCIPRLCRSHDAATVPSRSKESLREGGLRRGFVLSRVGLGLQEKKEDDGNHTVRGNEANPRPVTNLCVVQQ